MKLNKDNLVAKISTSLNDNFSPEDIKIITDELFDYIAETLADAKRVELRGFGIFSIRDRLVPLDPRNNTSSNSNRVVKNSVYFRPARKLHDMLKGN